MPKSSGIHSSQVEALAPENLDLRMIHFALSNLLICRLLSNFIVSSSDSSTFFFIRQMRSQSLIFLIIINVLVVHALFFICTLKTHSAVEIPVHNVQLCMFILLCINFVCL